MGLCFKTFSCLKLLTGKSQQLGLLVYNALCCVCSKCLDDDDDDDDAIWYLWIISVDTLVDTPISS
jgi:hypothetical protein